MTTPSEFMDKKLSTAFTTSGWTFWNIEPPTPEDIEDSEIPIRVVSEAPEDEHDDECIHCQLKAVTEAHKVLAEVNENLAAELFEIKGSLQFLIKMLGGK